MLSKEEQNALFESLLNNTKKTIQLDLSSCMMSGNGLITFRRARKGKAKTFSMGSRGNVTRQAITLLAPNQTKASKHNAYRLWRSTYSDGSVRISASCGDLGLIIKDIRG